MSQHKDNRNRPRGDRAFDRNQDMGGSGWSGASGRGGMSYEERYGREAIGAHSGDPRLGHPQHAHEHGIAHVPGQRWGGGYGGDQRNAPESSRPMPGRGFTGNDFGPPSYRTHEHGEGRGYAGTDLGMGAPTPERGPHYGKGPKGYKRSDQRMHEEICEAIAHQGHIDASDVEVKVDNGIVTLSGTVAERHHKRRLEDLVEQCRGVEEVRNELRLKREGAPATPAREDARPVTPNAGAPTTAGSATLNQDGRAPKNGKIAHS